MCILVLFFFLQLTLTNCTIAKVNVKMPWLSTQHARNVSEQAWIAVIRGSNLLKTQVQLVTLLLVWPLHLHWLGSWKCRFIVYQSKIFPEIYEGIIVGLTENVFKSVQGKVCEKNKGYSL